MGALHGRRFLSARTQALQWTVVTHPSSARKPPQQSTVQLSGAPSPAPSAAPVPRSCHRAPGPGARSGATETHQSSKAPHLGPTSTPHGSTAEPRSRAPGPRCVAPRPRTPTRPSPAHPAPPRVPPPRAAPGPASPPQSRTPPAPLGRALPRPRPPPASRSAARIPAALTLDGFSPVQLDLSLALRRVALHHDELTAGHGAVQLPLGAAQRGGRGVRRGLGAGAGPGGTRRAAGAVNEDVRYGADARQLAARGLRHGGDGGGRGRGGLRGFSAAPAAAAPPGRGQRLRLRGRRPPPAPWRGAARPARRSAPSGAAPPPPRAPWPGAAARRRRLLPAGGDPRLRPRRAHRDGVGWGYEDGTGRGWG